MPDAPLTQRDAVAMTQAIRDLTNEMRALPDKIAETYVRKDVLEPRLSEMQKDIDAHSDWLTWAQRIIIGAVILALLGVVISQGGAFR
jgi:hypothetical protein